jgi:hypothetical protein
METKNKQSDTTRNTQGFIAEPKIYLNQERQTLTHRLGADIRIEMPVNLYKSILGMPFEKKEKPAGEGGETNFRTIYGLIARPAIYLSKDKNYLIHQVLGTRVVKHVNYYKRILSNVQGQSEAQSA